jgi:F-type H+-transporting ATPase subunit epsilon
VSEGFRLTVITQEKKVIDEQVASVTAPGAEGYLGIWKDHAPLVTALDAGKLSVRKLDDVTDEYALSGGFLEVSKNVVTVLADTIELDNEIDPNRAEKAIERAMERLNTTMTEMDAARVHEALKRNKIRVKLAKKK